MNLDDIFGDILGTPKGDAFARGYARAVGKVPDAKKCETHRELADWFKQFANACHAALPAEKQ